MWKSRSVVVAGVVVTVGMVLFCLTLPWRSPAPSVETEATLQRAATVPTSATVSTSADGAPGDVRDAEANEADAGFLYGRVLTQQGVPYEGRLRWGQDEEAFWNDHFNGFKAENPWTEHVPPAQLEERRPIEVFGRQLGTLKRTIDLRRPFRVRFGDIARIDVRAREIHVTLRNDSVFVLDRLSADDLADGIRIWDRSRGVIDLEERAIRRVEFTPTRPLADRPDRLHGTVRTRQGDFTGFVQWDRDASVDTDVLVGRSEEGEVRLPFGDVRAITRLGDEGARVTLHDDRVLAFRQLGQGHRGLYVDDARYGRVLISWDAFEGLKFDRLAFERMDLDAPAGNGPGYGDFTSGQPLQGTVILRSGQRHVGRLVYDLDESETTETLDASFQGVDYIIPFAGVESIEPGRGAADAESGGIESLAEVTLRGGEVLALERAGDLGEGHGGMLVFADGETQSSYVAWRDVARVEFKDAEG